MTNCNGTGVLLGPDKGGAKPYRLLAEAMQETERAALAKYAARGKDHLVLLRPYEDGLLVQQIYYADEIRSFDQVPVDGAEVQPAELELALQIIEGITSDEFAPEQYEDTQRQRTWEMIERKIEGQEIVAPPAPDQKAQVVDLMQALKASLGETEEKKPAKRAAKKEKVEEAETG